MSIFTKQRIEILYNVSGLAKHYEEVDEKYTSKNSNIDDMANDYIILQKPKTKLFDYLMTLDCEDVNFIRTVMYLGRNGGSGELKTPNELYQVELEDLPQETQKNNAHTICGKIHRLTEYIPKGMKLLNLS